MADQRSSRQPEPVPYFPPPRKRVEPSPYRKAGAAPSSPAAEPVKTPVIVSRPEPPAPAQARRRTSPRPPPVPISLGHATFQSSGAHFAARILGRYPRLFGLGMLLYGGWTFGSALVGDHQALLEMKGQYAYLHEAWVYNLGLGFAAVGSWLLLWGIPMDPKTARPRDTWKLGLFVLVVLVIAARAKISTAALALLG